MKGVVLCLLLSICTSWAESAEITKIAFGSCNKHNKVQHLWQPILDEKPQVFAWLGDAVYLDSYVPLLGMVRWPEKIEKSRQKFDLQKQNPEYSKLLESDVEIIGVWDDHDYGKNDGGAEYRDKAAAQELYLDFLDEPADSPRRQQEGVYAAYTYGPPERRVKMILLDVRYFQDKENGDLLGERQWEWLESELGKKDANFTFIASGIQIVPVGRRLGEGWMVYPKSRDRLFNAVARAGATGVVLLSGDVHFGQMTATACVPDLPGDMLGYPLIEVTSSGLTHTWGNGFLWMPRSLQATFSRIMLPADLQIPDTLTFEHNFGIIDIDWETPSPTLALRLHSDGGMVAEHVVTLEDLTPKPATAEGRARKEKDCAYEKSSLGHVHFLIATDWTDTPGRAVAIIVTAAVGAATAVAVCASSCLSLLRGKPVMKKEKKQ